MDPYGNLTIPDLESAGFVTHSHRPVDFITLQQYFLFFEMSTGFRLCICMTGIVTNSLTIRTFKRLGLKDSVTIVFFLMAVSDLIHILFDLLHTMADYGMTAERRGFKMVFTPEHVGNLGVYFSRAFAEVTYLTNLFLALQRCLCVAMPLHFKAMFTRQRTYVIMATIWLFPGIFTFILMIYSYDIKTVTNPDNTTTIVREHRYGRQAIDYAYSTTFFITLTMVNQVVVTACVIYMTSTLTKSVRFRKSMGSATTSEANTQGGSLDQRVTSGIKSVSTAASSNSSSSGSSSSKERQAIIQVTLVSMIFLGFNLFRVVFALTSTIIPEYRVEGAYRMTWNVTYFVMAYLEGINASVNFFVYYFYNSSFRNACFRTK